MGGTVGRLLDYLSRDQRFESNCFSAMGRKERRDRVECFNAILAGDCFRKCVEKRFIFICIYFHFFPLGTTRVYSVFVYAYSDNQDIEYQYPALTKNEYP
jgi:hypothetical protein